LTAKRHDSITSSNRSSRRQQTFEATTEQLKKAQIKQSSMKEAKETKQNNENVDTSNTQYKEVAVKVVELQR